MIRKNKLFSIVALCFLLSLQAMAQDKVVSLNLSRASLREVMTAVETQTDYRFSYRTAVLSNDSANITIQRTLSVRDLLREVLPPRGLDYEMAGQTHIVLRKQEQTAATAAPAVVNGTVYDKQGEPIIGANIIIAGTSTGTITDFDGNFSIEAVAGQRLQVSYIGYRSQEIAAAQNMRVVLSEDTEQLDEVVVVGYGTQKKVNLTGAVSVVDAKDISNRSVANAAQALQGADPGLNIVANSGSPDAGMQINIRGVSSLTSGASPLVLIDGVEGSLSRLNANDIESVSILKDASASAIYGAKASAGVVLVTTKNGAEGKAKISYSYRAGWSQNTTSTDYITTGYWSAKINDMFMTPKDGRNYTGYTEADYAELEARLNDKTENPARPWVVQQADGTYKYYANFDWYNWTYRQNRMQQEHNLSISGGNDKVKYYVSGRYFDQDGIFQQVNDYYKNYSVRAKLTAQIKPWVRFTTNTNFFASHRFFPGMSSMANMLRLTYAHALACVPATTPEGYPVYYNTNANRTSTVMDGVSAIFINNKHRNTNLDREIVTRNRFDFDIIPDLTLTAEYAYSFRYREYRNRSANVPYSQKAGEVLWLTTEKAQDYYQEQYYRVQNHNLNIYATYSHTFAGAHSLKLTGGGQFETYEQRSSKARQLDLSDTELDAFNLATGEVTVLDGSIAEYATLGFFLRANYDYAGRYLVELSARGDGSSRFAPKHRWVFVPSASLGWRMSEERFWQPISNAWSNSKLRFSIGSLGNQNIDDYYTYIESIRTGETIKYTLDGKTLAYIAREDDPKASDLTWETVTTYDLGWDFGFLRNRLTMSIDGYIRDTRNMLCAGMKLPSVYGADEPRQNIADMRTRGWEFSIGWADSFRAGKHPFEYSISFGLSDYVTDVTRYNNPSNILTDYYTGQRLGEIWGYHADGLFASQEEVNAYMAAVDVDHSTMYDNIMHGSLGTPGLQAGDIRYADLNGDGVISYGANTLDNHGDLKVIGNTLPRYNYNIKLSLAWNGIDFSAFFTGVGHQDWYPSGNAISFWGPYSRPYCSFIPTNFLSQVWSEDNTGAYFPRARGYEALEEGYSLNATNDRYLQNVAYFRLKNLTLGYTVPLPKNKVVSNLRFYLSGENLFYFSPLRKHSKYVDPEQATSSDTKYANSGVAYNFNRTFSIGASIDF